MKDELSFRRIYLRLTRAGYLFIAFALAAGFVAVNAGNNLLFILLASLLALLTVSGVLAYMNIRKLTVSLRVPGEVFAENPATVLLDLTNRKRLLSSFLLTCERDEGGDVVAEILPGRTESLSLRTTFGARGRQPLKEMILTSEFPFGLVRRGGYFTPAATCLVYPRPERVAWRFLESAEREGEEHSMPLAGVGGDYRGLREYLPGDSLSRVQWKGWLRHRRLMTKEFESEGASPVIFSFDKVPGPDAESRISQLTWLVRAGFRRGKAVGLVLPGRTFPPAVGALHRKNILTALALYGAEDAVTADQPSL